jgi:endo-1,4-beta-D-glucanase Y/4-amino-4-deoxy-L-arabinose transferase-like glycosyltransferase
MMNKKIDKFLSKMPVTTAGVVEKTIGKKVLMKGKIIFGCIVGALLVVTIFTHAYGMFKYPYYENDEGVYMSQAHSLVTEGKLSPYTYWYDHAPAGWITLASWSKVSGGFFTFGPSVNSGRALMLILHVLSAGFIFYIALRLSKSYLAASIATLLFTLSPLAIYYQRRVLLDNMMIFWVLLSMTLLYIRQLKPWHIFGSAVVFGIAVLTKESAVVFTPALLYILLVRYKNVRQRFTIIKWLSVLTGVVLLYPLYALSKGEFFPKGFRGDTADRLSLVDTFLWQAGRGSGLPFWNMNSEFFLALKDWIFHDPFLTIGGIVASIIVIGWSLAKKDLRMIAVALLFSWIFLLRGGLVFNFYIIPVIPFMAIAVGMIIEKLVDYIGNGRKVIYVVTAIIFLGLVTVPSIRHTTDHYTKNETAPQVAVVRWVKQNLPASTSLAIDDYAYADYHDSRFENKKVFHNADIFWKLESDPQIRVEKYKDDWRNIEYVVASSTFKTHLDHGELAFVKNAFLSSRQVKELKSDDTEYAYKVVVNKVNPDMPVEVAYTEKKDLKDRLYRTFRTYKRFFFRTYGQIIDPTSGVTTSEGQSYAMLRAVWLKEKEAFDGSWEWTHDHLQHRESDSFISWKWVVDKLEDSTNATDADEDIALALLFAYKQWGEESYLEDAKEIIYDLGEHAVVKIDGTHYFMPAHWESIEQWNGYLFNPSYLSPASYRVFAKVDPEHNWDKTADDSYKILDAVGKIEGNSTYLPFDWVLVDKITGKLSSANEYFDYDVDKFSFDAFRTLWRVALDYQWFHSYEAQKYLENVNVFLMEHYKTHGRLPTSISPSGEILAEHSTPAIDAGYLASLMILRDNTVADKFYNKQFEDSYNDNGDYWGGDKYNYYNANWAWFGTAMYNGNLVNLWDK